MANNKNSKYPKNSKGYPKSKEDGMNESYSNDVPKSSKDRRGSNCAYASKPNDWHWYAKDEQLLKDTASIPTTYPLGNRLNFGPYADSLNKNSIPGVLTLDFVPTYGYSDDPNSPMNVAARKVFTFVRKGNSGYANYNAPDLMLYLMAMDNVAMCIANLKRQYGIASLANIVNRYYPTILTNAVGGDYASISNNMADFRAKINILVDKFRSMAVPADITLFDRHEWLVSGYYADDNLTKAQLYAFNLEGCFKFSTSSDTDGAGSLDFVRYPSGADYNEQVDFVSSLLDPILADEDFNIMSGDIAKAFGLDRLKKINTIAENYVVLPSVDSMVLDQIQNSIAIGTLDPDSTYNYYCNIRHSADKGWLEFTPFFMVKTVVDEDRNRDATYGLNPYFIDKIINFDRDQVGPADVMEATRLTNIANGVFEEATNYLTGDIAMVYKTIGSEVICHYRIFQYREWNRDGKGERWALWNNEFTSSLTYQIPSDHENPKYVETLTELLNIVPLISNFKRHPYVYTNAVIPNPVSAPDRAYAGIETGLPIGDVGTYGFVTEYNLTNMANVALMSLFNVPEFGK